MKEPRSYQCPGCSGIVAIPDYARGITLDMVRAVHVDQCPMPAAKRTRVTTERKMARKAVNGKNGNKVRAAAAKVAANIKASA